MSFGLFHFTYPAPWNASGVAVGLGVVWLAVSAVCLQSRSILGATLFNNFVALIGFISHDLDLPGTTAAGLVHFAAA